MGIVNADWLLYVMLAIGFAVLILVNIYILVLWQHPDDRNEAYWPKTLVVRENAHSLQHRQEGL